MGVDGATPSADAADIAIPVKLASTKCTNYSYNEPFQIPLEPEDCMNRQVLPMA